RAEEQQHRLRDKVKAARRLKRMNWGLMAAGLLAAVAAVIAVRQSLQVHQLLRQEQKRTEDLTNQMAAAKDESNKLLEEAKNIGDPKRAFYWVIKAFSAAPTEEAKSELQKLLQEPPIMQKWLAHDGQSVWDVIFSADGSRIATGGGDSRAKLWNSQDGKLLDERFSGPGSAHGLAFSRDPKGEYLAAAFTGGRVSVWEIGGGHGNRFYVPKAQTLDVSFNADGVQLGGAWSDQFVRVWDFKANQEVRGPDVSFSAGGVHLAGVWSDKLADVWAFVPPTPLPISIPHRGQVNCVVFSPGEREQYLATAGEDGIARLWDAKSYKLVAKFEGHTKAIHSV